MAGGKKDGKGGGGGANTDLKREEKLQAVVLADVCARKLRPATFDGPKALMPLANAPLLEYTLEFLCAGGVEEVFVFACHGTEAIQAYLRAVETRFFPTALRCIASRAPCFSAGDALREVYEANVIQGDFVLAPGDVVTNLYLPALIAAHRAARERDKDTLLTACFARIPYGHRIRPADDGALLVVDSASGRLLHYESMPDGLVRRTDADADAPLARAPRVELPLELLDAASATGAELRVRLDLFDLGVDVCTLEVLTLLVDNFDWAELRTDMLTSVLSSEILGKTIHVHEMGARSVGAAASAPYAARVSDWRTYVELSADVLARWSFPQVPDANLLSSMDAVAGQPGAPPVDGTQLGTTYRQSRGNAYAEEGVSLARSAQIGVRVLLGGGSSIGADARVTRSVLGRRCSIGDRTVVVDSVLWAGVTIGEGASVRGAVLCEGVVVGAGASIGAGCVLGRGVVVGAGVKLQSRTLYTRHAARALRPNLAGAAGAGAGEGSEGCADRWAEGDEDSEDAFSDDDEGADGAAPGGGERAATDAAGDAGLPADAHADAAHALGAGGSGFLHGHSPPAASCACARPRREPPLEPDDSDDGDGDGDGDGGGGALGGGDVFIENALDILAGMLEDKCAPHRSKVATRSYAPSPCTARARVSLTARAGSCLVVRTRACSRRRRLRRSNAVDNIVLEVNALKFAYNRSVADCAAVSLQSLLARVQALALRAGGVESGQCGRKALLKSLKEGVHTWAALLRRYVTTGADQQKLIEALEVRCRRAVGAARARTARPRAALARCAQTRLCCGCVSCMCERCAGAV